MSEGEQEHIERLWRQLQRRLNILQERAAIFGLSTPPELIMEIEDIYAQLAALGSQLGTSVEPPTTLLFRRADPGEMLVIVAPFVGGFHSTKFHPQHRLRAALQQRIDQLQLAGRLARLEIWQRPLESQSEARRVGRAYQASLVAWGEYDDHEGVRIVVELLRQPRVSQTAVDQWLHPLAPPALQAVTGPLPAEQVEHELRAYAAYLSALAIGMAELSQEHMASAEQFFSEAISLAAQSARGVDVATSHYWRGMARVAAHKHLEAYDDLTSAVAQSPHASPARAQRGILALEIGRYQAAERDFTAALAGAAPDHWLSQAILLGNLGIALDGQGKRIQARRVLRAARRAAQNAGDPGVQALSLARLGAQLEGQGALRRAGVLYKRALDLYREHASVLGVAWALTRLGNLCDRSGAFDDALGFYQQAFSEARALGIGDLQARILLRIGGAQLGLQQLDAAEASFTRAMQIFPERDDGRALARQALALIAARRVPERDPNHY